jgi:uncharacterized membrane protein
MANPAQPTSGLFHPPLIAAGAALLIAALVTDLFYWNTALFQWANFSVWLITGGLILALLAGLAILLDLVLGRAGPVSWVHLLVLTAIALLSLVNAFIHSRDAWTSVVPQGLILSALVAVLLVVIGWRGWSVTAVRAPARGDRS